MTQVIVAHCDWSVDPRKRWMAIAAHENGIWHLNEPEPVGEAPALFDRLRAGAKNSGSLVVGFDFPIGVPAAYGKLTGLPDFRSFLSSLGKGDWHDWFDVCSRAEEINTRRPFYPMRPGGTKRIHLEEGLGIDRQALLRACERATPHRPAACSLFWTLGGNQVGKGAISGWLEVLQPNLAQISLWPFGGTFEQLTGTGGSVAVETYPGDAYGQLGLPAKKLWSKRTREGRQVAGTGLVRWIEQRPVVASKEMLGMIKSGFTDRPVGEDQFDAVVGLFGMLDVLDGRRPAAPDGLHRDTTTWEGWILGQVS